MHLLTINKTSNVADNIALNIRMNSEKSLEGTWKETAVAYFEVFSLLQSDESVTEPRSEPGNFRLLSDMNDKVSAETLQNRRSQRRLRH
jgi:hypothetical protein